MVSAHATQLSVSIFSKPLSMVASLNVVDVLDSDEEDQLPPFNDREWIGKNRKYPRHPPQELEVYCARQLRIPQEIKKGFPHDALSVTAFSRTKLPAKSYALVFPAAETCFSMLTPSMDLNQTLESLKTRPLPPTKLVDELRQAARQAILDGNLSVVDSRFPGTRFSFWVIATWRWLIDMVDAREEWKAAQDWVDQRRGALVAADVAAHRLLTLGWNVQLVAGERSLQFARAIRQNAMLEKRVSATRGLASRVILLQRAFMIEILKAERAEDLKDAKRPYLTALERKVKDDGVSELWFTALWEEQIHWLAFKCDFANLTLSYGRFNKLFRAKGNALTCGAQDDGISCGFIAINTLAHNTLGDDIWTASLKIHDRLHWFNLVCTEYERDNAKLKYVETRAVDAESKSVATQSSHTIPKSLKRILNSPEPSRARPTSLSRILNPAPVPPTVLPPPVFVAGPTVVADVALPLSRLLNDSVDAPAGVEWLRSCTPWDELANAGWEDTSPAWGEEMRMDVDEESTALLMEVDVHPEPDEPVAPPAKLYSIFGTQYSGKRKLDDAEAGNAAGPCKIARIEERPAKASKGKAKTAPAKSKAVILHPVGTSKTAKWEHKNNARYNEATEDDAGRLATFKTSIRAYDEFAEVLDSMNVRHSRCGKPYIMKTAYNTGNFKTHTKRCRGTLKYGKHAGAGGHPTVDTILKNLAENPLRANAPNEQSKSLPCSPMYGVIIQRRASHRSVSRSTRCRWRWREVSY
ncbi:hypothetical protein R3P38DRAFT_3493633 [Favolaschia claudopus]|uniref:Uncharacterized protein n=1 Tax=Favolaschia claudopus TaxID=2862362 RepID=A0AAW0C9D2_9AGAR